MKRTLWGVVVFVGLLLCFTGANAALLEPDLLLPDIFSTSPGSYTYDAGTGVFTATAIPGGITYDGASLLPIIDGSYQVSFLLDAAGNLVGGVAGHDFEISGDIPDKGISGLLIAGEVKAFGYADLGKLYALFDFTFEATDGALLNLYVLGMGGSTVFVEKSNFDNMWDINHQGTSLKSDTAPVVPVPTTLLLLGSGLVALLGVRRRLQ